MYNNKIVFIVLTDFVSFPLKFWCEMPFVGLIIMGIVKNEICHLIFSLNLVAVRRKSRKTCLLQSLLTFFVSVLGYSRTLIDVSCLRWLFSFYFQCNWSEINKTLEKKYFSYFAHTFMKTGIFLLIFLFIFVVNNLLEEEKRMELCFSSYHENRSLNPIFLKLIN